MKNHCLRLALFVIVGTTLLSVFSAKALAKDSYGFTWTIAATPSAVVVDSANNIYYAGYLASGSATQMNPNFNLGAGQISDLKTATTGAIFLTKMNPDLTYNTSYIIEADNPYVVSGQNISVTLTKIATDSANNVYLLGTFTGNVNFNPTGSLDFHSSKGQTWSFLTEITAGGLYGGTYLWGNGNITVRDLTIDKDNNLFLLGQAVNSSGGPITVNLNPVGGIDNKTVNAGDTMGFYTELVAGTPNAYGYSRTFKNTSSQYLEVDHIATSSAGKIFLYGVFADTMNFNGSGGTDNKTSDNSSDDLYLSEYDASGNYVLTYIIGGTGDESAESLAIDNNSNVYYSGGFNNTVNFDPTGGTDSQTATLPGQRFLSKLNSDGSYGWTLIWNSNTLDINKIAFDQNNLMYLVGISAGTINYDPIGATDNQTGFGGNDAFMTVINPDKTYDYTYVWGGTDDEKALDGSFDSLNNFYIAGSTQSLSVNFDPTGQTDFPVTFTGGENGYITQFSSTQLVVAPPTNNSNNAASGPGPQGFSCTNHVPVAPQIFQIWATQTTATIYFVPSADPQNSYTISYGLYSDAGMYNVTFSWSDKSGAIPYTINALSAGTPYYFKVRANNGCMPGEWSNTLALSTAYSVNGGSNAYAPSAVLSSNTAAGATGGSCSQYTVLPGDSFWSIAQKLLGAGTKYLQIWNANKTAFPSLNYSSIIRSGWTLSVGC
ncbi:MAG: LysM peptidoglycan-binding domain-containing protein [Candidatus Levyibacteriota bacterium]